MPKTPGQRLKARREYLSKKQEDVAEELGLSRTAYGQYETGASQLTVERAGILAGILGVSASWLAFGVDDTKTVQHMKMVDGKFAAQEPWVFDEDYIRSVFNVHSYKIALVDVSTALPPNLQVGDLALVEKGVEPSHTVAEFVFILDDEMLIAPLSRLVRSSKVRVHLGRRIQEVPADSLNILGAVVGKIAKL